MKLLKAPAAAFMVNFWMIKNNGDLLAILAGSKMACKNIHLSPPPSKKNRESLWQQSAPALSFLLSNVYCFGDQFTNVSGN